MARFQFLRKTAPVGKVVFEISGNSFADAQNYITADLSLSESDIKGGFAKITTSIKMLRDNDKTTETKITNLSPTKIDWDGYYGVAAFKMHALDIVCKRDGNIIEMFLNIESRVSTSKFVKLGFSEILSKICYVNSIVLSGDENCLTTWDNSTTDVVVKKNSMNTQTISIHIVGRAKA